MDDRTAVFQRDSPPVCISSLSSGADSSLGAVPSRLLNWAALAVIAANSALTEDNASADTSAPVGDGVV